MASLFSPDYRCDEFSFGEPSLEDLFAEPIVKLFMERDQVDATDMRQQIDILRRSYTMGEA